MVEPAEVFSVDLRSEQAMKDRTAATLIVLALLGGCVSARASEVV